MPLLNPTAFPFGRVIWAVGAGWGAADTTIQPVTKHSIDLLSQLSLLKVETTWRSQGHLPGGGLLNPFTSERCGSSLQRLWASILKSWSGQRGKTLSPQWSVVSNKRNFCLFYTIANRFTKMSTINLHWKATLFMKTRIWNWYQNKNKLCLGL